MKTQELQRLLAMAGYYLDPIDGIDGRKTQAALIEFEERGFMRLEDIPDVFYPRPFSDGKEKFISACRQQSRVMGIGSDAQVAYILATVDHETGGTFRPVKEGFDLTEAERRTKYRKYYPYYGRGFVQLTWAYNYAYYSKVLGYDLLKRPDKALDKQTALFILVHGMSFGKFTGRKLEDYVRHSSSNYENARRVINGNDRKEHVAELARRYLTDVV